MDRLDEMHRMAVVNKLDIIPEKVKLWSCKYCGRGDFVSLGMVRKHQKEAGCGSKSVRLQNKTAGRIRQHAEQ